VRVIRRQANSFAVESNGAGPVLFGRPRLGKIEVRRRVRLKAKGALKGGDGVICFSLIALRDAQLNKAFHGIRL
jgi:hypothetical protein